VTSYATDTERLEARRQTWRESTMRRYRRFLELREQLGVHVSGTNWQAGLTMLERIAATRDAERAPALCPDCRNETDHANGVCLFCHPVVTLADVRCDNEDCGEVIPRPRINQRFCSTRCKDTAWRRTEAGLAWADESNRRRRERRRLAA
jgi:hypothetical protein